MALSGYILFKKKIKISAECIAADLFLYSWPFAEGELN